MTGMRNRVVILVAILAVVAAMLACSSSTLVSREEATATPTKTPKPTFTATLTPTLTPIPTDTPTPTLTPLPTNTPLPPTATFTPFPTFTPLPPATDTPPPPPPTATRKPQPAKPKPTATPKPPPKPKPTQAPQYAWNGQVSNLMTNCGLTRVFGFTLANNGGLAGDIWVHYWADGWNGAWAKSSWTDFGSGTSWKGDEGNWDGTIDTKPRDGTWHVCVVPEQGSWDCVSNTVDARTSFDCNTGSQVVHITFRKN